MLGDFSDETAIPKTHLVSIDFDKECHVREMEDPILISHINDARERCAEIREQREKDLGEILTRAKTINLEITKAIESIAEARRTMIDISGQLTCHSNTLGKPGMAKIVSTRLMSIAEDITPLLDKFKETESSLSNLRGVHDSGIGKFQDLLDHTIANEKHLDKHIKIISEFICPSETN